MRMAVTDIVSDFRSASPIVPKMKPENNRARYGNDAKTPACAKLKPRTSLMNFGAAVIRKYKPHKFPKCKSVSARNGIDVIKLQNGGIDCNIKQKN